MVCSIYCVLMAPNGKKERVVFVLHFFFIIASTGLKMIRVGESCRSDLGVSKTTSLSLIFNFSELSSLQSIVNE